MKKHEYRYGIEIECILRGGHDEINHDVFIDISPLINVHDDSSINGFDEYNFTGAEITIGPATMSELQDILPKVLDKINEYDGRVNSSCGLHIHVSHPLFATPIYLRQIVHTWLAIEDVMLSFQPPSRIENQYCYSKLMDWLNRPNALDVPRSKVELIRKFGNENRYRTLNLRALSTHGTIECRLHSGTIDETKIMNWVNLLTAFYEYGMVKYDKGEIDKLAKTSLDVDKIVTLFSMLQLDGGLIEFYKTRINATSMGRLSKRGGIIREADKLRPKLIKQKKRLRKVESTVYQIESEISDIARNL